MTALIILLSILILLLIFVLFAPIRLHVDTLTNSYYIDMGRAIRCSLYWKDGPLLNLRVLFFRINVDPLKWKNRKEKTTKTKEHKKKGKRIGFRKILHIMRTFKVKVFNVGLDTDNVMTNAALFPPAVVISRFTPAQIRINYSGENYAVIEIENRVARLIWAYMAH